MFKFNEHGYNKKLLKFLKESDYILISIPPQSNKDVVLKTFGKFLKNLKFKKLIYLSATSVYGNHNGKWVNEKSKLKGKTKFGLRRKIVEKAWIKLRNLTKLDINILRVSGIYSKENNVLKKIINNNIYVKEKNIFQGSELKIYLIIKKLFILRKIFNFKCL